MRRPPLLTLLAHSLAVEGKLPVAGAAWYRKSLPTFADAIAPVRQRYWSVDFFISVPNIEMMKIPVPLFNRLADAKPRQEAVKKYGARLRLTDGRGTRALILLEYFSGAKTAAGCRR